jgi:hypothetical protein
MQFNDLPVGRNVDEILRLVQAFQHNEKHGEVCPSKWSPGKQGMDADHKSQKTLKYWKNDVAVSYGIQAIPQNYLLDPNGVIIGKNLRGEVLQTKLRELFR